MLAKAVWHGTHLDGPALSKWTAEVLGEETALPEDMLGQVLAQQSAGLKTIKLSELLKGARHGIAERT